MRLLTYYGGLGRYESQNRRKTAIDHLQRKSCWLSPALQCTLRSRPEACTYEGKTNSYHTVVWSTDIIPTCNSSGQSLCTPPLGVVWLTELSQWNVIKT